MIFNTSWKWHPIFETYSKVDISWQWYVRYVLKLVIFSLINEKILTKEEWKIRNYDYRKYLVLELETSMHYIENLSKEAISR